MHQKIVWVMTSNHPQPRWGNDFMVNWKQQSNDTICAVHLILGMKSTQLLPASEKILRKVQLYGDGCVYAGFTSVVMGVIPDLKIQTTDTEWRIRLPFGFDRFYFSDCAPLQGLPKSASIYVGLGGGDDDENLPEITSARFEIDLETAAPRNNYKRFVTFQTKYSGSSGRIEYPEYDNVEAILVKTNQDPAATQVKLLKGGYPTTWWSSKTDEKVTKPNNPWLRFVAPKPTNTEELIVTVSHPEAKDCILDVIYEIRVTE